MSLPIRTHVFLVDRCYYYNETDDKSSVFYFTTFPDQVEHLIYLDSEGVQFFHPPTDQWEFETWDYFESPEDVMSWIYGWINDILDQEELEEEIE